jgi:hypothetical protein
MKRLFMCAVAVLALTALMHAGVVIGTTNSENCIPWSCQDIHPGDFQQIYNGGAFPSVIDIGSISFFDTFYNGGGGIASMSYMIDLAVTSQSVPDGSIPAGDVLFASGSLNGQNFPFGDTLTFTGAPFFYDPSTGNLELTVLVSNESGPLSGRYTYFDAGNGNPFSSWSPAYGYIQGYGLVTGFTATPEPSTLFMALMGAGVFAVGGGKRLKRRSSSES